jgi:hypothetical protein
MSLIQSRYSSSSLSRSSFGTFHPAQDLLEILPLLYRNSNSILGPARISIICHTIELACTTVFLFLIYIKFNQIFVEIVFSKDTVMGINIIKIEKSINTKITSISLQP